MAATKQNTLKAAKLTTIASVATNTVLATVKIIVGLVGNSAALFADGIHSFADMISDFFTYAIIKVAHADADDDHPYGHGKFETIGTMAMALLLAGTALAIGYSAIFSLFEAEKTQTLGAIAIFGALISIAANEGLYRYCKYWGDKVKSSIIIANAWHHRTDSLSSIAALVGIGLSLVGFPEADALAAIIITFMLLRMSFNIGKQAFDELVDAAVEDDIQQSMLSLIKNTPGAHGAHRLRARRMGGRIFVDAHVDVDAKISASEAHAICESVEHALLDNIEDIYDVTVHIDPAGINPIPLPKELERDVLEAHLQGAISDACPEFELDTFYFHLMKSGTHLEITLSGKRPLTFKESQTLRDSISRYTLAFSHIQIAQLT